jgi:hypothetical protein
MRTISVFCFVLKNSQEMKDMKMQCIKLQVAVSDVHSDSNQNVDLFSDLGVLPDAISEETGTAVECLQCVISWEDSCRITVIAYKDNVKVPVTVATEETSFSALFK